MNWGGTFGCRMVGMGVFSSGRKVGGGWRGAKESIFTSCLRPSALGKMK